MNDSMFDKESRIDIYSRKRRDRRHNEKHIFDDEKDYSRKMASHKGHSHKHVADDMDDFIDDDNPYAELAQDWMDRL